MSYDASFETERLIRAAGRCPELSAGLRERVIAASVRTRTRVERRLRWDHTLAVCGLLLWLGIFIHQVTTFPLGLPRQREFRRQVVAVGRLTEDPFFSGSDAPGIATAIRKSNSAWACVEAASDSRLWKGRLLRRCLSG